MKENGKNPKILNSLFSLISIVKYSLQSKEESKFKIKIRSEKIFKSLSTYMGNRTPAQCRSHYQKMIMKFKTIAKLKKHFKQNVGEDLYNESFKKFSE